jgi:hypothetical protein
MFKRQITQETLARSCSKQKPIQHMVVMIGGEPKIPKVHHLEGAFNYGIWAYIMKHVFQHDNLFSYYVIWFSSPMNDQEIIGWSRTT